MACNCTPPSDTLEGDPDILGYGVTVAFIMSAVMTVTAVLAAYLSDSMPEEILSETDEMFISTFQQKLTRLVARPCFTKILHIWSCVWTIVTRMFRRDRSQPRQPLSRKQREAAFTRFILTLSDQQLVVGLAILIAITGNQCTISVAEYEVAFSLAWFSITTHLATLDSLRRYFTIHKTVRNIRVLGMVVVMAFFCYSFVIILIAQSGFDDTIPIQCYVDRRAYREPVFDIATLVPWTITWALYNGDLWSRHH
ncbi:hypothetical protein FB567DRAFT_608937 [Paraphoma chrysanthemicola]|uniref:Uncharacterized protein n=1 Tax=Paraphoma chrysanthemicola TaxID=798071 RepID=A0A8K0QX43_9PLEO|nr:hypothetical protein FB567DRAFT_608937 [Paraphoma chrysanthemicola]